MCILPLDYLVSCHVCEEKVSMKRVAIIGVLVVMVLFLAGCSKQSVAFDAQNETPITLQEVARGKTVQMPDTPEKTGHRFLGWYTDISGGEKWDFSSPVETNLNLYGVWEPELFSVVFDFGIPATEPLETTVPYGQRPQLPPVSDRDGYRFTGWFSDSELTKPFDIQQPIVEDTRVYAGWEKLAYPLRYHVEGVAESSIPQDQAHYGGSEVDIVGNPVREGFRFVGWNTQPDGLGDSFQPGQTLTMQHDAMDLYAQWAKPVSTFDAGSFHSMVLLDDGTLLATGNNGNGQLGNGNRVGQMQSVAIAHDVRMVSAGGGHTLFIDNDGVLWGMGANYEGQLGGSSLFPKTSPIRITGGVVSISAGGSHSMILKEDRTLWTMGNNEDGQLGDGSITNRSTPVRIADKVTGISAGSYHSAFIKEDGSLWTMGWNRDGQLGDGSTNSRSKPVRIDTTVAKVSAGGNHTLFVKDDGSLWAMGSNESGQLGDGGTTSQSTPVLVARDVVEVVAAAAHSLYIDRDGTLWGTGDNSAGQLAKDGNSGYKVWTKIGDDVGAISAGDGFSIILGKDGILKALGANDYGQLGEWKE